MECDSELNTSCPPSGTPLNSQKHDNLFLFFYFFVTGVSQHSLDWPQTLNLPASAT
jgi:hypothetical protein